MTKPPRFVVAVIETVRQCERSRFPIKYSLSFWHLVGLLPKGRVLGHENHFHGQFLVNKLNTANLSSVQSLLIILSVR